MAMYSCSSSSMSDDNMALMLDACQSGTWEEVSRLLWGELPVDRSGSKLSWEPFHFAMMGGNCHVAENFLRERVNVGLDSSGLVQRKLRNGEFPIHTACRLGEVSLVNWIIKCDGYRPEMEDEAKDTALHVACAHGHDVVLNRLMNCGDFQVDLLNSRRETPLHKAVMHGHIQVVRTLLRKKANVNHEHPACLSPLHLAVMYRYWDIVHLLLQREDIDIHPRDGQGLTAFQRACFEREHYMMFPLNQSPPAAQPDSSDPEWWDSAEGSLKAIKAFLRAGTEINLVDYDGSTPLGVASIIGDRQMAQLLLNHGARVHVENALDPLWQAQRQGHKYIVRMLKEHIEHSNNRSRC